MRRHPGTFTAGIVFLLIGAVYFVDALGGWTVDFSRIWPVILIAIGVTILFGDMRRTRSDDTITPSDPHTD
jgi:hypothetical protein